MPSAPTKKQNQTSLVKIAAILLSNLYSNTYSPFHYTPSKLVIQQKMARANLDILIILGNKILRYQTNKTSKIKPD